MVSNLASLRQRADLSRRQLAKMVGLSDEAIRLLEIDQRSPNLNTAYRIAQVLQVRVEDIWPVSTLTDTPTRQPT